MKHISPKIGEAAIKHIFVLYSSTIFDIVECKLKDYHKSDKLVSSEEAEEEAEEEDTLYLEQLLD